MSKKNRDERNIRIKKIRRKWERKENKDEKKWI